MAKDDYGAISVISEEEREILGIGGPKKPEEEEKLFETIGKADDKIVETKVGKKITKAAKVTQKFAKRTPKWTLPSLLGSAVLGGAAGWFLKD